MRDAELCRCSQGKCCSKWGFCGTSHFYCSERWGCQEQFGRCGPVATNGTEDLNGGANGGRVEVVTIQPPCLACQEQGLAEALAQRLQTNPPAPEPWKPAPEPEPEPPADAFNEGPPPGKNTDHSTTIVWIHIERDMYQTLLATCRM